jgi:hypothetical protein
MAEVIAKLKAPPPLAAEPAPPKAPAPVPVPASVAPPAPREAEPTEPTVIAPVPAPRAPGGESERRRPVLLLWAGLAAIVLVVVLVILLRPGGGEAPAAPVSPEGNEGTQTAAPAIPEPVAAPQPADRSWLFQRWCLLESNGQQTRGIDGRPVVWTFRELSGDRILSTYPGQSQTETIRTVTENRIETDKGVYTRSGNVLTAREGNSEDRLEVCR